MDSEIKQMCQQKITTVMLRVRADVMPQRENATQSWQAACD
jgi:hypothetical protein